MNNLKYFLKENKKEKPFIEYKATKSLKDENGEPVEWLIRCLNTAQCEAIRIDCTFLKGGTGEWLDTNLYLDKLLAASVVEPDLNNAELQDSYGVYTPEALLKALIDDMGEYEDFCDLVFSLIGLRSFEDRVREAKN